MENLDNVDYLTTREVAEMKGISTIAVLKACKAGRLVARQVLGRWLVLPADAQAWTPGTWGDASRMKKKEGE